MTIGSTVPQKLRIYEAFELRHFQWAIHMKHCKCRSSKVPYIYSSPYIYLIILDADFDEDSDSDLKLELGAHLGLAFSQTCERTQRTDRFLGAGPPTAHLTAPPLAARQETRPTGGTTFSSILS